MWIKKGSAQTHVKFRAFINIPAKIIFLRASKALGNDKG